MKTEIEWINVKDRLPTTAREYTKYYSREKHYLVCNKDGLVFVAKFMPESYNKELKNYFRPLNFPRVLKNIIMWAELPTYIIPEDK